MHTRSRFGCTTCRQRKKKCDQGRPSCGQCSRRGVSCGGYATRLTWSNAVATRGFLSGRTAPVSDEAAETSVVRDADSQSGHTEWASDSPLSYTSPCVAEQHNPVANEPIEESRREDVHVASLPVHRFDDSSAPTSSPATLLSPAAILSPATTDATPISYSSATPSHLAYDPESDIILETFYNHGAHSLYATRAFGPFIADLRDLVPEHEALRFVCILLQRCISEGPTVSVLEQTDWVLKMFRAMTLEGFEPHRHAFFTTGFLICSLHLIQGLPWTATFYHLLDLYCPTGDLSTIRPNPQYHLSMRCQMETLALLDIATVVVGRARPSRGLWPKFRALQATWNEKHDGCTEPTTGLPRTLLDLMAHQPNVEYWEVERALHTWAGPIGDMLSEHLLWECYRNARILSIRHEQLLKAPYRMNLEPDDATNELIVFRLLNCLNAVLNDTNWPNSPRFQAQHVALYPLVYASIQISTLRKRPAWRADLYHMREKILAMEQASTKNTTVLFEILDEAWHTGSDGYNLDEAARRHGVEITII